MTPEQNLGEPLSNEKVVRLVRPSIVVLCGPAGCGKSTFAASHFRPTQVISSDQCRALVCDDEQDQRFQAQAFALLHFIIEQRLSLNRLCVVDSTALTYSARRSLLEVARRYRVPCVILAFEVPLETCVARDEARLRRPHGRAVGRAVIERQYRLFEEARNALAREGFERIESLQDDELQRVRFEIVFRPAPRVNMASVRQPRVQHHQPGQSRFPSTSSAHAVDPGPPPRGESGKPGAAPQADSVRPDPASEAPAPRARAGSNSEMQASAAAAKANFASAAGARPVHRSGPDQTGKQASTPQRK